MNTFIAFTVVLAVAQALPFSDIEDQWEDFKVNYGKSYESEAEENMRKEIFAQNLKKHEEHNKKFEEGIVSYTIGVNHFADITNEEFIKMLSPMNVSEMTGGIPFEPLEGLEPALSVDWRKRGAVSPVKFQGHCGSCYAFSAAGSLEGQLFMKTNKLTPLSVQNLIDCSQEHGNHGCNGGLPSKCFNYLKSNGGIDSESSYPYEGKVGKCRYKSEYSISAHTGFVVIPKDEGQLLNAVTFIGPISVGVNALPLLAYSGGVFHGECDINTINHAVLVVGFGTSKDGQPYWIIKNSWGTGWGEDGYIRLLRNKNQCGVATLPTYPIV